MSRIGGAVGCAVFASCLAAISGGAAVAAGPDSSDTADPSGDTATRANALFAEGRRLLAAGDIPKACAHFEESQRLLPRGGTLLNLGLCHAQEGKLSEARDELRAALDIARRSGRTDREPIAAENLAAVEARISREAQDAVVASADAVPTPPTTPAPLPAPAPPPVAAASPSPVVLAVSPSPSRPTPHYVWAGAALTGALAVTTTVVGLVALDRRSDFLAMRTSLPLHERAASMQHWATAALGATTAAGAMTLILYLRRPDGPPPGTAIGVGAGTLLLSADF